MIAPGCTLARDRDVQAVQDTIARYNQLLAEGYAKMIMTPLREVATDEQAQKVYYHMAALGESRVRMESRLKKADFLEVKFPSRTAAVAKTRELWEYAHINIDTGKTVKTEKDVVYSLVYELVKKDGRWIVTSVTGLNEK